MKTFFVNRKIVVSIVAMILLLYGVQGICYGQLSPPIVKAGDNNTTLRLSFKESLFWHTAYQFQLRRKAPQGDWSVKCGTGEDIYDRRSKKSVVIFTDLEPRTTYQVRWRSTNQTFCSDNPLNPGPWSPIAEGTTLLKNPQRAEFTDISLATVVRWTLGLDIADDVDILKIPIAPLTKLTTLKAGASSTLEDDLGLPEITDLTGLEHATQLRTLYLRANKVLDITPLTELTQLTEIDLWRNQVSDIAPLEQLTQLRELNLGGNHISDITPLEQLTKLRELDLGSNQVSDIAPLEQLTQLTKLDLGGNHISDITSLAQLTQLTTLTLGGNQISDITPLAELTRLTLLSLTTNEISDLSPLAELTQLKQLYLGYNQIRDLTPLTELVNLGTLWSSNNKIRDLMPLVQLVKLETLFISSNQIRDVTPLKQLADASLTYLDLRSNQIRDVSPLADLVYLEELSLDGNSIRDTYPLNAILNENPDLDIDIEIVQERGGPTLTASTDQPLTGNTLDRSIVTLKLSSGAFITGRSRIRDAMTISGVDGIGLAQTWVKKISDTEVSTTLTFTGTIDKDTTLTLTVGAAAIENYNGPALTAEIPVSASTRVKLTDELVALTAFPLTKATLDGSVVILTLQSNSYEQTNWSDDLYRALTISGIPGVTARKFFDIHLLNDKELLVQLNFDGNLDADATLTFTVAASIIVDYSGRPFVATLPVAVKTELQVLVPESQRPQMYWINTDTDKIGSLEPFNAITQQVASLTVDAARGKVYWSDHGSSGGRIKRANLDGTNVEVLTTRPITPQNITVDTVGKKLYWIDSLHGKIESANLNGENIRTVSQVDDILHLAVDTKGGKLYWAGSQYNIRCMNLDGTNVETPLVGWGTPLSRGIGGIAIADGKIYWTEKQFWTKGKGKIHRANLNGTNAEILATPLGVPTGIAVDTAANKVYWANSFGGIQRVDINDGEIENVVTGITAPGDFALVTAVTQATPSTPETSADTDATAVTQATPSTSETSADTDAVMSISPASVASPAVGQQLALNLNITGGENVAGYQVTVQFDTTALRYVSGANGDYLPAGAFFVQPKLEGNLVKLNAASLAGESSGNGTLATLTFEVIAAKSSTLTLSDVLLTNSAGETFVPQVENAEITEATKLKGDVNGDGIVNIADLVLVAANLGETGQNAADVNGDGQVNIADLVLVAGALSNTAAAPSLLYPDALEMLTAADIQPWLTQAQHLNLTDITSQQGIRFLEQLLAVLIPKETSLLPNYPNPFNPETWIPYQLAKPADVTLTVYAVNGEVVRRLALGHQLAGNYQNKSRAAYWDGRNSVGEPVASGVYFFTLTAGDFTATRKMLIAK